MPSVQEVTDPKVLEAFNLAASPETEAAGATGEPIGSGKDAGLYSSFVSGFSKDENDTVHYLAKQLYPDEPTDQAVKRFGKKDGVIFHRADDGNLYEAMPHGFASDVAGSVGPSIPIGTGTAVGIGTAPISASGVGLPVSIAATAGAAAGGEAVRQGIGNVLMGDAATPDLKAGPIAEQAALGASGQAVGAGVGALATRGAVRDINQLDPVATQQAYTDAQNVDIPITPAEATGLPTLAAQQKRLTNITPTADTMRGFTSARDKTVIQRWNEYLDTISTHGDAEKVGKLARDTASNVLKDARQQLQTASAPFYQTAFAKSVPYTSTLDEMLPLPAFQKAITYAKNLAENSKVPFESFAKKENGKWTLNRAPSMEEWHYIKKGLDSILQSDDVLNKQTGGMNEYGKIVTGLKRDFLSEIDRLNPAYAKARQVYSDGAEEVTTAMGSALNTLAKTKDVKILDAARHLFNPASRSPDMVRTLKTALETKDPNAWQAIKRLYMQDVTQGALRISETGEVPNVAGKLHKVFTDPKLQENLFAAMSPAERQRYTDLMVVFKRAASVPALRSDTEFNRLMSMEAEKSARPLSAKIARGLEFWKYPQRFDEWRTAANMDKHASAVVDLITSGDPEAINTMKELRRLSTSDRQWVALFGHLLDRSGAFAVSEFLPESDQAPGDYAK